MVGDEAVHVLRHLGENHTLKKLDPPTRQDVGDWDRSARIVVRAMAGNWWRGTPYPPPPELPVKNLDPHCQAAGLSPAGFRGNQPTGVRRYDYTINLWD